MRPQQIVGRILMPTPPDDSKKRFNPLLARTRAMGAGGASGWEAYTVGFTLVGCIVAGAGVGWFLDNHFGTNYWLPILFLVGVGGGFREMLLVLKRINAQQEKARRERTAQKAAREITVKPTTDPTSGQIAARQRMFEVPPPFEEATQKVAQGSALDEEVGVENVLEQMLAQGDLNEEELKELGFDVELPGAKDKGETKNENS